LTTVNTVITAMMSITTVGKMHRTCYINTDGGPSGHPQSCCASGACASGDYSDPENIEWSDSEDDGDQPWSDQGEWNATHLVRSSR
jgi:hypothetical protein